MDKTRAKVKGAVQEIAKDLVKLYAARQEQKGFQYGSDTVWQKEFEELFPYDETEDQLDAIDAVKIGYGKPKDHGPSDLRRRGIRKNRNRPAGRV